MDDETRELIDLLCTRAGMVMEDASVLALTTRTCGLGQLEIRVGELEKAVKLTSGLIRAAQSLIY